MKNAPKKNILEWSVFGIGLVGLLALVVYFVLAAVEGPKTKPDLRVRIGQPEQTSAGYRTTVTVENQGDESTMGVKVKVDDTDLEFDYIPRRSKREGSVVTEKPPKEGRVLSWQAP